jgi:hypothetical protein
MRASPPNKKTWSLATPGLDSYSSTLFNRKDYRLREPVNQGIDGRTAKP